jgi:hypothetical protein
MKLTQCRKAVKLAVTFELTTPLMLRSGKDGLYADSTLERTADGRLHVNGYVFASLMRRALGRVSGAEEMARAVGDYPETAPQGVSPFWCEPALVPIADGDDPEVFPADIRHGNRIHRQWGATADRALYADEVLPPGYEIPLHFIYFADDPEGIESHLRAALWVIDQGIETIGGGWSYGYGRLKVKHLRSRSVDLTRPEDRETLWDFGDNPGWTTDAAWASLSPQPPALTAPWTVIRVDAGLLDGQLMAVQTTLPPFDFMEGTGETAPDTYVFRRNRVNFEAAEVVIPGKAIRQALLSVPLERKHRSGGETVCDGVPIKGGCDCVRCRWFGSADPDGDRTRRGIVSVADAVVESPDTVFLNRIQLCEHSMQNMNLFTGEFLRKGRFPFEILVDGDPREESPAASLIAEIKALLGELQDNGTGPPGWHRLGGTSTCTGQVAVHKVETIPMGGR